MIFHPLRKSKRWDDSNVGNGLQFSGYVARIWVGHFFPSLTPIPANDRDHLRW